MRRELFFLAVGAVLGASAVLIGQQDSEVDTNYSATLPAIVSSPESEKFSDDSSDFDGGHSSKTSTKRADVEAHADQKQPSALEKSETPIDHRQTFLVSTVPDPYDAMLKPRELPKNLRTPELYEKFKSDIRDNSWADAMELGINQYIAERGPELEVVFDFVECRSRYCVVAGVSYSQDRGPWNTFNPEMSNSSWWLATGGNSTVGGTYGNETRFATVISREPSDIVRPGSSGKPSDKPNESSAQSVKVGMAST